MDSITHEILIWKHIQTERVDDYKYLLVELLNLGYTILSVTIDGKRGVNSVFKDYPVQMCHFHQKRIICSSRFIRTLCRRDSDSFKVEIF